MARLGLAEAGFACLAANDVDPVKCAAYRANFGGTDLIEGDVAALDPSTLPGGAALAWASFPCQDLSLAGGRAGLAGARSGVFWSFWRLIQALDAEGRGPPIIAIENVLGLASARGGRDLHALFEALAASGRAFAALAVDAALFLPQSRPRLFVLAWPAERPTPPDLAAARPAERWTPTPLARALAALPKPLADAHRPLDPSPPAARPAPLESVLEPDEALSQGRRDRWRSAQDVARLLSMMTERHRTRVEAALAEARATGRRRAGGLFRRMRADGQGGRAQRAEVRFDRAGCLRTPAGGSSRQTVLIAEADGRLRARLLTGREAARLMGLPDDYILPRRETDALKLAGDGVATPAAAFIGAICARLLASAPAQAQAHPQVHAHAAAEAPPDADARRDAVSNAGAKE